MTESNNTGENRENKIERIIESQRLISSKNYEHWCISTYWGQIPNSKQGNVQRLGYCGYAVTQNVEESCKPDLSSGCGTQVIIGPKSVIVWSSSTEEGLNKKIKTTFKNFKWDKAK